jgi:NTE family protein
MIVLAVSVFAKERPSVGLVLSGGGARGGAHVGILKFLEEKHIPVDYIVGTSMGSFMGGLYASGYSADELATFLTTTPWEQYVTAKKPRRNIPFRRKQLGAQFPGNIKVGINAENEVALPTGVFEKQMMLRLLNKKLQNISLIQDFTKLPIPYTAVATRLADGEVVPLSHGSLPKSIYASICVPGGFEPIEIDGEVLVDGGISQNLPVAVMRELFHPDYIIVVDISTPFDKKKKFDSYDAIMTQQIDILTRKNVEDTISNLRENEILIEPHLEGYSFLDADKYAQIIKIGYGAAKKDFSKFSFLSLDETKYREYVKKHRYKPHVIPPIIDAIEIQNATFVSDAMIRFRIHQQVGTPLDFDTLQKDLMRIYYLMYFSSVDYKIIRKDGKNVLVITTKPSWNAHGDIRVGIAFEDDFNGHSDYLVRFEYNKYNLNKLGGEWRNRIEVGKQRQIKTELYQPLEVSQKFYTRLNGYYEKVKHYVTPQFLLNDYQVPLDEKTMPLYSLNYGAVVGFGVNMSPISQVEMGVQSRYVNPSADVFLIDTRETGGVEYTTIESKQHLFQAYIQYMLDSFDNPFFPKKGYKGFVQYYKNFDVFNSKVSYSQIGTRFTGAYSFADSTVVPMFKFGSTLNSGGLDRVGQDADGDVAVQDIAAYYQLGGLFNISGRPTYYTSGDQLVFGSLNYRYSILSNKFLSSITSEAYLGCSIEAGKAWYKTKESFSSAKTLFGSSIYLAIDTIIGPFYLAYGYSDKKNQTIYFSLGKSY